MENRQSVPCTVRDRRFGIAERTNLSTRPEVDSQYGEYTLEARCLGTPQPRIDKWYSFQVDAAQTLARQPGFARLRIDLRIVGMEATKISVAGDCTVRDFRLMRRGSDRWRFERQTIVRLALLQPQPLRGRGQGGRGAGLRPA